MILSAKLFWVFFKVSLFAFGGGLSILPLLFETIRGFSLMNSGEFADLIAISQVTPGPMVVNAATYVGMIASGVTGAIAATMGVAIPSFVAVILAMKFLDKFKESENLNDILEGIRPATCGMIGAGLFTLLETVVFDEKIVSMKFVCNIIANTNCFPLILFIITIILVGKFELSPISVIIIMGLIGMSGVWIFGHVI